MAKKPKKGSKKATKKSVKKPAKKETGGAVLKETKYGLCVLLRHGEYEKATVNEQNLGITGEMKTRDAIDKIRAAIGLQTKAQKAAQRAKA